MLLHKPGRVGRTIPTHMPSIREAEGEAGGASSDENPSAPFTLPDALRAVRAPFATLQAVRQTPPTFRAQLRFEVPALHMEGLWRLTTRGELGTVEVVQLQVEEGWRGRGAASAFLAALTQLGTEAGRDELWLECVNVPGAERALRRAGFAPHAMYETTWVRRLNAGQHVPPATR
jgi:GNAT superfamily N-acetyltransferase